MIIEESVGLGVEISVGAKLVEIIIPGQTVMLILKLEVVIINELN